MRELSVLLLTMNLRSAGEAYRKIPVWMLPMDVRMLHSL